MKQRSAMAHSQNALIIVYSHIKYNLHILSHYATT